MIHMMSLSVTPRPHPAFHVLASDENWAGAWEREPFLVDENQGEKLQLM